MRSQLNVALGSNLPSPFGTPLQTICKAREILNSRLRPTVSISSKLYTTPAYPPGNGGEYVNAVMGLQVDGSAETILELLHGIEAEFARERSQRWGQRTLDLDLLTFGDMVLPDRKTFEAWYRLNSADQLTTSPDVLIVPHPRLHERGFVLRPLADVAPDWRHPVSGRTVTEMLTALPDHALEGIRPLEP